jgi:hypothetical protein
MLDFHIYSQGASEMHASESLVPRNRSVMKYIWDISKMINVLINSSINDAEFSKYQHTVQ